MANDNTVTTKFKVDISDLKKGISDANQQIKLANAQFKAATAGMDDWSKSTQGIQAKLKQLDAVLTAQKQKLAAYKEQLERQQQAYKTNGDRAAELRQKMQELADKGVDKTSKEYKLLEQQLAAVEREQESNGKACDKLNLQILEQEAAVGKTEKEIRTYETSLNSLGNEMDDAEEDAEELGDSIDDAGDSAKDAGDGFTVFKGVLANLATSAIHLAVEGLKKLGTAIKDSIKDVSDYGDEVDKTTQKMGLSYASYQKWDYAMKIAGTSMSNMTTGLKTLTNTYDSAINGSKSAITTFDRLGLSLDDLRGKSREDIFGAVITSLQGIESETERAALASKVFGRSGQELLPLLNQTSEETQKLIQQAEEYGMVMSDDAVRASADYKDSLTLLSGAVTGLKNKFVGEMLPGLSDLISGFAMLINGSDGASEALSKGAQAITQNFSAIIPKLTELLTSIANELLKSAPTILTSLANGLLSALPQLLSTVSGIAVPLVSSLAQAIISAAPSLLSSVVTVVGTLISQIGAELPNLLKSIAEIIPQLVDVLLDGLPLVIQGALTLLEGIVSAIPLVLPPLISALPQIIDSTVSFLVSAIPMVIDGAVSLLNGIVAAIPKIIPPLISALPQIIDSLINGLIVGVPLLLDGAIQLLMAIIQAIPQILPVIADATPQIISSIVSAFISNYPVMLRATIDMWMSLVRAIPVVVSELLKALPTIISALLSGLVGPVKGLMSGLWDGIKKIFAPVNVWFKQKFDAARTAVTNAFQTIGTWFSDRWNDIKNAFSKVGSWFKETFEGAWQNVKDVFANWGSFFDGLWETIKNKFSTIGTNISNAISSSVRSGLNGVISSIESIINRGIGLINGAIGLINKMIPGVSIGTISRLSLPRLARGGVLEKGQIGLLEGSGAEAVVPLENNRKWIRAVAATMADEIGTKTIEYNFTQNIYSPEPLSRIEIYRQTRNQINFAKMKAGV